MYLGIDVGGTKTLVTLLDDKATILDQRRFDTPKDYDQFIAEISKNSEGLPTQDVSGCVVGIPGLLDRDKGTVIALGNLPWRNKPVGSDISRVLNGLPVTIENDARLAGLSEARLVLADYQTVLFLTISTGIGGALIKNGQIVTALQDTEMGKMPLMFEGKLQDWEEFAGGRGMVNRLGERADDITDPADWDKEADTLTYGLGIVCSILQPEVVILGGPVGAHTDEFCQYVTNLLEKRLHPVVRRPKAILAAKRPKEAVVYGCYDLAKQIHG